jgi:O-antigen/teichoic acid export membrane protein
VPARLVASAKKSMTGLKAQAVRNVSATWLSLLVHALVSFFLSPFVLHRLGDAAFSVWILVFSLTGYFGLLDFGIRSSIVRYVARFIAVGDDDQLGRFLATSVAFYLSVALVVLVLTTIGSAYLPALFKIPPELLRTARLLFWLGGLSVAMTFPLSVFAGVMEGLQKFAHVQLTFMFATLLRGLAVVIALSQGGGLLALAAVTIGTNICGYLVLMWMAYQKLPLQMILRRPDPHVLHKMVGYGAFAFLIAVAEKLRFQSDAIVIGAFLSSTAITYYSVASRLVEYSTSAVRSLAQIVTPMSSQFHATGDRGRLCRLLIVGNRACALVVFPLAVTLVVCGRSVIEVWVGARYVSSYSILVLLIVPKSLYLAQSTSTRILLGMGRHRILASVLLLEGVVNVVLSFLLAPRFGLIGVAWGTAIPLACTSLLFLPRHLCRQLEVPLTVFLRRTYLLPLALCLPLAGVLWLLSSRFPAHNYQTMLWQLACGGLVYGASVAWSLTATGRGRAAPWRIFEETMEPGLRERYAESRIER